MPISINTGLSPERNTIEIFSVAFSAAIAPSVAAPGGAAVRDGDDCCCDCAGGHGRGSGHSVEIACVANPCFDKMNLEAQLLTALSCAARSARQERQTR